MKKSRLLGAVCVCISIISFSASAALVTHGYLSTYDDGSSNLIYDSLNNVEYLRFDVIADLNYAQTLAVLGTQDGGGWAIATPDDALNFTAALLGGTTSCTHDGTSVLIETCGTVAGWQGGDLGDDNYLGTSNSDVVWFMDESGQSDDIYIFDGGRVDIYDGFLVVSDEFSQTGSNSFNPVSWLVVRPAAVPLPSAVWLFSSGLLGLIGVARRKAA